MQQTSSGFSGQTIRGYELQQQIGQGAAGGVYKAYQPSIARYVAIKIIRTDTSGLFERTFNDEARLIAQLEHPNIVPLYDFWSYEQAAYLVMRLLTGGTLRERMAKQAPLSLAQTIKIVDQVTAALTVAHEAGVIHRDIKPENILFDEHDNAYLADFGIAKQVDRLASDPPERVLIGTLNYVSPEQASGGKASTRSDLYSLGLVVYEMLTGRYAYDQIESFDVIGLLDAHIKTLLPSIAEQRPDLPPDIDWIVRQATDKSPARRYESAHEFAEKLRWLTKPVNAPLPKVRPNRPMARSQFSPRQRNRDFMLSNVRKFWIEGVLNQSLYSSVLIDLDLAKMSEGAELVGSEHPWDLAVRTEQPLPDDLTVLDCFDHLNGKLLILGQPGSGKTTTLLELTRDLLTRAERDDEQPIPVVFNLSSWSASRLPIAEWLVNELNSKYQAPKNIARGWVSEDQLLLLLDGLDEVAPDQRESCVAALNTFRAQHSYADLVICSRIADYEALSVKLKLNGAIIVQPLNDVQIDRYMDQLGLNSVELRRLLTTDPALRELTRTPFMLSVLAVTYGNRQTQTYAALRNAERYSVDVLRRAIFATYVERVFERRPVEQGTDAYPKLSTIQYLTWLATNMRAHAQSVFQIEGLQSSWLTAAQRQDYYRAVRIVLVLIVTLLLAGWRSLDGALQHVPVWWYGGVSGIGALLWGLLLSGDGFKRRWLAAIPGVLLGLAWGGAVAGRDGVPTGVIAGLVSIGINVAIFLTASILLNRTGNDRDHIVPAQNIQFARKRINGPIVLMAALLSVLYYLPKHLTAVDALATVLSSLTVTIVALIGSGLGSDKIEMNDRPNDGMYRSLRFGLLFGGIVALTVFVAAALQAIADWTQVGYKVIDGITSAITIGHGALLIFGLFPLIHHLVLRWVLTQSEATPRDYAAFLDYASQLTFLRKVGNGYIFIHRYLLEFFAELPTAPDPAAPPPATPSLSPEAAESSLTLALDK